MRTPKSTSAAKKKKRLAQLRDAQRRRRDRLKCDSKYFVQIILAKNVLDRLQAIIAATGETMQQAIGRLVEASLPPLDESPRIISSGDAAHEPGYETLAEITVSAVSVERSQKDGETSDLNGETFEDPAGRERLAVIRSGVSESKNPSIPDGQLDLFG